MNTFGTHMMAILAGVLFGGGFLCTIGAIIGYLIGYHRVIIVSKPRKDYE